MIFDYIVIGSGVAGLFFSIKASRYANVLLITKDKITESNTYYAQGGVAAVLSKNDSYGSHIKDTMTTGCGLNKKRTVKKHVRSAPNYIKELIDLGVEFERKDGVLKLTKEANHSHRRIVFTNDTTGKEIEEVLVRKVKNLDNVKIIENSIVIDLIRDETKCKGVISIENKKIKIHFAKAVILATGGLGQLYSTTTNPKVSTGDGYALAKRASARLKDMEFIQFHPTKFFFQNGEPFLISETLRGEGGVLKNINGTVFMKRYHKQGDLAPRDVVSRAITFEMKKTNSDFVYLDVSHLDSKYVKNRFPNIYKHCLKWDINITKKPIPVVPGAHYMCGGVETDLKGGTTLKGLYASGEVARTGLHGANRLASNSMMEAIVFSNLILEHSLKYIKKVKIEESKINFNFEISNKKVNLLRDNLRKIMWENVGIIRKERGLWKALHGVNLVSADFERTYQKKINREILELRNMLIVGREIIKSAIKRKKSIGCHYIEAKK